MIGRIGIDNLKTKIIDELPNLFIPTWERIDYIALEDEECLAKVQEKDANGDYNEHVLSGSS
jgi:hypothetical protein